MCRARKIIFRGSRGTRRWNFSSEHSQKSDHPPPGNHPYKGTRKGECQGRRPKGQGRANTPSSSGAARFLGGEGNSWRAHTQFAVFRRTGKWGGWKYRGIEPGKPSSVPHACGKPATEHSPSHPYRLPQASPLGPRADPAEKESLFRRVPSSST